MATAIRALARRALGVSREPTYYLPWLTAPGLDCALVLSNVEARFKVGWNQGPYPLAVRQYDAEGRLARRHDLTLRDVTDVIELPLDAAGRGYGIVTVSGERIHSDLYVTVSDGVTYTATHGRGEWIERYPSHARLARAVVGGALALTGRAIAAFTRHQYVYVGADSRSHVLVLNLSDVTNHVRVAATREGGTPAARLLAVPPLGARLLDVAALVGAGTAMQVWRLRLTASAWFNYYLVGTGARDLAGPVSLMHVK
jgi:hypothetical protein